MGNLRSSCRLLIASHKPSSHLAGQAHLEKLLLDQVKTMITFPVREERALHTILHSAAVGGSADVFEALLAVLARYAVSYNTCVSEALLTLPAGDTPSLKVKPLSLGGFADSLAGLRLPGTLASQQTVQTLTSIEFSFCYMFHVGSARSPNPERNCKHSHLMQ